VVQPSDTLALFGGPSVLPAPLSPYRSMGHAELAAVTRVVQSGRLSGFYGSWSEEFWGGAEVRCFEREWASRFRIAHAVSVNSATSGLYAAMGAIGISPGDEVIVPPYTMSATVMAPLIYGGIPVFADIEPETFGLDPVTVEAAITPKTRAIIAVNLFGHPARLDELRELSRKHDLYLVEDNAQAPLAEDNGRPTGTIGDIGVFSLNFHKHIHTGEGGMCVTNNDQLALRMKLIRNHGENVVEALGLEDTTNLVGFNFRLTEIQAAIGIEQLKRIDEHVQRRERLAKALTEGVSSIEGLAPPKTRPGCRHVYYTWALRYDEHEVGVSREVFCRALAAEGFPHAQGYVRPLYLLPVFQQKVAIGREGFPFTASPGTRYEKGMCPVCERMHEKEVILFEPCAYEVNDEIIQLLVEAIHKVYRNRDKLKELEARPEQ
jgi:perosamine synthetase